MKVLPQYRGLYKHHRFKILLSGRASGKSVHACCAILWYASRARIKVVAAREFLNSIAESSKAQFEQIIEQSGTSDAWYITHTEIVHKTTGSRIIFKGIRNNTASIKSIPGITILFIEEAEDLSMESWNILEPTIREEGSEIWVCANPKSRSDTIPQLFVENEPPPDSLIIRNSYLDNPFVSSTLLAQAEHMCKINNDLFQHIWMGKYLELGNLVMVPNIYYGTEILGTGVTVIGVDIARQGGDRTCICVRRGRCIVELLEYSSMDKDTLVVTINSLSAKYNPKATNIDTTGHGAWAGDILRMGGVKNVFDINFSANARDKAQYHNVRSELYSLPSKFFELGGYIHPNQKQLAKELQSAKYTLDNKNRIKLLPKDEQRTELGMSPDLADAFVLSLYVEGDMVEDTTRADAITSMYAANSLISAGSFG